MRRFIAIVYFSLGIVFLVSGQELIVTAQPSHIAKGEITRITYRYEGKTENPIRLPDFTDFDVISGPSRKQSISIINGRKSVSVEVSVDLLPRKTGTIGIPPATIEVNHNTINSNTLFIHVAEEKQHKEIPEQLKENRLAITAEINKDSVFQGEQIVITYRLLFATPVESYSIIHESNYDGSLRANFKLDEPTQRDTVQGEVFRSEILEQRALFPYQTGSFDIDPIIVNLQVPDENARRGSFFFRNNLKSIRLSSNSLHFVVLPQNVDVLDSLLPVGNITLKVNVPDSSYSTDDVIPVIVRLGGNTDPGLLRAPKIKSDFPFFYPNPKEELMNKSVGSDGIYYLNTFKYFIQPQDTGAFSFQFRTPFLKESGELDTLFSETFTIPINKGKHYDDLVVHSTENNKSIPSSYLLFIGFSGLVVAIVAIAYLRKRKKEMNTRDKIITSYQDEAKNLIRASISAAEAAISSGDGKKGVSSLLKTMRQMGAGLSGKRLHMQYSTRELYESIKQRHGEQIATQWDSFLKRLEKSQYGMKVETSDILPLKREIEDWCAEKFPYIKDNT